MDEKHLVARAKKDPQAFGELYELYIDRVFKYVKVRVGDETVTEDIVSDAWLKILKNIGRYNDEGKSLAAWIFTIVANTIKDHYRKRRTVVSLQQAEDNLTSPDDSRDSVLTSIEINHMLKTLTKDQREAILLRYAGDLRIQDIAEVLGKSEGAIKTLLARSVKRLREEMEGGKQNDAEKSVSWQ